MIDLGCGVSDAIFEFSKRGFEVTGIDFSQVALNKQQEKINSSEFKNIKLINQDLNNFEPIKSDIYLCNLVYKFIEDKDKFLNSIKQSMPDDSVFILITPVLHEDVKYTKEDKPNIAVDFKQTLEKLENVFSSVTIYNHDYIGARQDIVSFVIKKQK